MTLLGLSLLVGSSWTLGALTLARMDWKDLRPYERAALTLLAGLGLTSLLISLLTLAGGFRYATWVLGGLSLLAAALLARDARRRSASSLTSSPPHFLTSSLSRDPTIVAVLLAAALACLGAIAPVTDDDALAYVVPIAQRIARTGALTAWPDQARSMWPQSQQVLLAYLTAIGGHRLGALTALEFVIALGVFSAFARRVCARQEHVAAALILAFGCPVVAFQVSSAKEDLLVVGAAVATALMLAGATRMRDYAAAGVMAGIAAGAKYPGAAVALAAVSWPLVSRQPDGVRRAAIVALCATMTGGLWYALNLWRYGNPVAPFVFGAPGTVLDRATIQAFVNGYGGGRSILDFFAAPLRIFLTPAQFTGRANLFNPLVYVAVFGAAIAAIRRRHAVPLFIASVIYLVWFFTLQNARLLLPAAVLMSPMAADCLMPLVQRRRWLRPLAFGVAAVSVCVVAAVGSLRAVRYLQAPDTFLERETQNYVDLQWMNAHLNAADRVASDHKVLAYLDVPWLILDSSYQVEIGPQELNDPQRLLDACRRQGVTHLFGRTTSFADIRANLRPIYENPASRRGGVRFFREPPTEETAVFEILRP
jgi:hypothetical protein